MLKISMVLFIIIEEVFETIFKNLLNLKIIVHVYHNIKFIYFFLFTYNPSITELINLCV